MKAFLTAGAIFALSAGVASAQPMDKTLSGIMAAKPLACPAASAKADARTSGETVRKGITETEIARTALTNDNAGRSLRVRRLVIAPGGVLPWHDHIARQGMGLVVSGEMTEYRNDCTTALKYKAGDLVVEGVGVAHWWRNESKGEAVMLAFDGLPPV